MVTDKPLVNFVADPRFIERLNEWRFRNRFASRAEAIRWLIEYGMKHCPNIEQEGG